ncbi:putative holin-like toxin [Paenibacillus terricola]
MDNNNTLTLMFTGGIFLLALLTYIHTVYKKK